MASQAPPDPAALAAAQAALRQFTIEAWTLFSIGFLVTVLRTYARVKAVGFKKLQPDDYLVWVGVTFYAFETGLAYSVGARAQGLANNGMSAEERAALPPDSPEYHLRVVGSKIQLMGWSSYSVLLWSLKASLLVFYIRLTAGLNRSYLIRIYVGFGFVICSWIAVLGNLFLGCRPFSNYWRINPDPGNDCQPAVSNRIIWLFLGCNVTTDLYLLSIPIPMLWGATMKPLKKVGLMILFSGGLIVIACAILRVVLLVADPVNGAQLAGSFAVRETFVAVVTTNLPMVFPLLKTWLTPVLGSLVTSMRSTQRLDDKTPDNIKTFGGGSNQSWRGRGPPTANPITNFTFSESEERIVENVKMETLNTWSETSVGTENNNNNNNNVRHSHNNIRKDVEVAIVCEKRSSELPDRITVPGADANPPRQQQSHYAYARGPIRGGSLRTDNRN